MTTATRRLRRSGAAGLVAAVTAGVTLIATSTSAFAAELAVTDHVAAGTATTVFPGATAQAAGNLQVNVPNVFHIGDTLTVTLTGGAGCGITNGAVGFSAAPTVAATGPTVGTFGTGATGNTADVTPTFTSAISSSTGACTTAGVKDVLTLTFTNSSNTTAPADNYLITVSGQKINVGSAATTGAVNETPAGAGGTAAAVATVTNTKSSLTEVSAAPSTTATLNTLTLTEVTAGALLTGGTTKNIVLTLAGTGTATGTFVTTVTPTVTVPTGYTVGAIVVIAGSVTIPVTAPATAVAAVVTVAGVQVTVGAGTGVLNLTASTPGGGTVWGSAQPAIGVLNQGRVGGTDRYATAAQLFLNVPASFTGGAGLAAVLASGANYPDALSANYLAQGLGTRVLLTDPNVLPQPTYQALITAGIKTVYIVGGIAAVSANVANAIAATHVSNNNANAFINVIRVAGPDRYSTNNQVDLFNGATAVPTAIVAVGTNFADALAVAPVVVTQRFPLVLTDGAALSTSATSTLVNLGIKNVIIVGGTAAVSAAVEASIKALSITIAYRIAGADRTLTASSIATYETTATVTAAFPATSAYAALNGLGLNIAQVYVGRGDGFADALAAGTVAGGVGGSAIGAILLTGDPNTLGAGIPAYLGGKAANVTKLTVLGLTSAVSVPTANAAVAAIS